jgi:hypothetical protein
VKDANVLLADWANIAEVAGAIAVVVSLVYLAVQVRQNTVTVRNSTLHSNTALWSTLLTKIAEPGMVEAYLAGVSGKRDIDPLRYTQFFLLCRSLFVAFENQYYQYRQGALDGETYKGYERSISQQLLAFPGFRLWWQQSKDVFSPTFVEHVDDMMSRVKEIAPDTYFREWQSAPRDEVDDAPPMESGS